MAQFNGVDVPLRDASATVGAKGLSRVLVFKSADETAPQSSTTYQDDDVLKFAIGANETWVGQIHVLVLGDATADIKLQLVGPSGSTITFAGIGARTADTLANASVNVYGADASARLVILSFSIVNGATAGFSTLQWAQSTSTAADTTVKAGSFLVADRVA